jgi:hypothetical protein
VYKAFKEKCILRYKDEINQVVKTVSDGFDFYDCGLSVGEEKLIELLFSGIRKYILGIEIYNRN